MYAAHGSPVYEYAQAGDTTGLPPTAKPERRANCENPL